MPPFSLPTSHNPAFALQDIEPLVGNESEVSGSISQNSQEMQDRARRGKSKRKAPDPSEQPSPHSSKRKIADYPKTRRVFLAPFEKDIFCFNSSTMGDKFFLDDPGQASFVPMEAGAMEYQGLLSDVSDEYQGLLSDVSDEYQGLLSEESDKDKKRLFAVGGSFHRISEFHKMQSEKFEQDHLIDTEKMPNKYWDEIRDIDQEEENVKKSKGQNDRNKKEISEQRRITLDEYDQMESKILSDYYLKINPLKKNINDINERLNGDKREKEIYFIDREKEVRADIERVNKEHKNLETKIGIESSRFKEEFESQFADQLKSQLKELDDEFENKQKELEDKFEKNIAIVCAPSQPHRPFALAPKPFIEEPKQLIVTKLKSIVTDPVFVEFFKKKEVYRAVESSISRSGGERREGINFEDFTDPELQDFARKFLQTSEDKIIKSFVRILKEGKDAINDFLGQAEGPLMLKDFFLKVAYEDRNTKSNFKIKDKKISFFRILGFFIDSDFSFKDIDTEYLIKSAIYHKSLKFMNKIIVSDPEFFKNRSNVIKHIFESAEKGAPTVFSSLFLATGGCFGINEKDEYGRTVLNSVKYFEKMNTHRSKKSMVCYLLLLGADPLIEDNEGKLPIDRVPAWESDVKKLFEEYEKCKSSPPKVVAGGGVGGDGVRGEGGIGGEGFSQDSMETIKKQLEREKTRLEQQKKYKRKKLISEQEAKRPQELEKYVRDKIRLELQQINQEKARKLEQIEAVKNQIESDKAIFLQQIHEREINELQPIQEGVTRQERQKDDALSHMKSKKSEVLRNIVLEEDKLKAEDEKIKKSEIDLQKRRKQAIENYKKATEETKAKLNSDRETLDELFVRGWEPMPYKATGRS
jgi:hypothetical protein